MAAEDAATTNSDDVAGDGGVAVPHEDDDSAVVARSTREERRATLRLEAGGSLHVSRVIGHGDVTWLDEGGGEERATSQSRPAPPSRRSDGQRPSSSQLRPEDLVDDDAAPDRPNTTVDQRRGSYDHDDDIDPHDFDI